MTKETRAILPQYAYEIMMDIIKNHNLEEREKSISEQLKSATDPEIRISLINDKPILVLTKIAKKAAVEKLSEDEVTSLLREKLRIDKERAESLMQELKKKLIFFIEVIEIESEKIDIKQTSSEEEETGEELEENSRKNSDNKKKKDNNDGSSDGEEEEKGPDPYREPVE